MALFDDLSRKLTQASQDVAVKGRAAADTVRISAQISEEERKLNEYYRTLGQKYMEIYGENPSPQLVDFVMQIETSKKLISGLKLQMTEKKGIGRCPNCGASVSLDASFCPSCGSPMHKAPKPEPAPVPPVSAAKPKICGQCGAKLAADAIFCPECGAKVE